MKTKVKADRRTIKDDVISDFIQNKKLAEESGFNYFPSGLLKYYLYNGGFLTYEGRIVGKFCKENGIDIVRAGALGVKEWAGEQLHGNLKCFVFNK